MPQAEDVLLVIEIADSTLRRDIVQKARIYAASGIHEYWVVDVKADCVRTFSDPRDGAYAVRGTARRGDTLSVGFDPHIVIQADDMLG